MLHKNNKTGVGAIALTAVVVSVLVSGVAYGHWRSNNYDSGDFSLGQWNEGLPGQYSFDQNQLKAAQDIMFDCNEEVLPLREKLQRLELEAQTYYDNPDVQLDKIKSYRRQIYDARDQIVKLRRQANAKISVLLNSNQRSYFGNDFDWCDLVYDGRLADCDHAGSRCLWDDTYRQNGRGYYNGQDGCCW